MSSRINRSKRLEAGIQNVQTTRLLSLIEKFKDTPILLVGGLMLDHYVWGKVETISQEAPVVVVQVTDESE